MTVVGHWDSVPSAASWDPRSNFPEDLGVLWVRVAKKLTRILATDWGGPGK